jgi:hypothetical protein
VPVAAAFKEPAALVKRPIFPLGALEITLDSLTPEPR